MGEWYIEALLCCRGSGLERRAVRWFAERFRSGRGSSKVTEQGVPDQAVEPDEGVSEVEKAIAQVEEDSEAELPAEFTIKFGDTSDWLRLTSGEWLKGEVHRMREKDIEFDSDKLDLLTFSWSKVSQLHSPRVNTYVFEGRLDVEGRAVVTKEKVIIENGGRSGDLPAR